MNERDGRAAVTPLVVTWVVLMSAAMAGSGPDVGTNREDPEEAATVAALVEAHNHQRALADLPPLTLNLKLSAAAHAHSRDMAQHDEMTHTGSDGSTPAKRIEVQGYSARASAENVAMGDTSVQRVMKIWMNSPPHKKNILGDYSEMGAGRATADDGTTYWTVNFGTAWTVLDAAKAEAQVVDYLNRAREKEEKPRLKMNAKLAAVARRYAQTLAARDRLQPVDEKDQEKSQTREKEDDPFRRLEASGYRFARFGATSAAGEPTAEGTVNLLLKDPSNRDNLLGDFRDVGVGYATTEKGFPYWTIFVAKPRG